MHKFICFVFLCTVIKYVTAKPSYCYGNITFGNLPFDIQEQLLDALLITVPVTVTGCPANYTTQNGSVKFYYFNATSNYTLIDPDNPPQLPEKDCNVVLIHGWLCSMNDSGFPELRQAYFNRYDDCNIIGVDWSDWSVNVWSIAYCSVPIVGRMLGDLLCEIQSTSGITVTSTHVIGHSMGAHIAGHAGQRVKGKCASTIYNITGLDPGGLSFQLQLPSNRLDKGDAEAVQVIHTNMGILGYWGPCGTTDFFPNCGTFQKGCLNITQALQNAKLLYLKDIQAIINNTIVNLPLTMVLCDHFRAVGYYTESVNTNNFTAKSCLGCRLSPFVCFGDLTFPQFTTMGENCPPYNNRSTYILTTNPQSPFAKGWAGAN